MSILEQRAPDKTSSLRKRASRVLSLFPKDKKSDATFAKDSNLKISQPVDSSWQFSNTNFDNRQVPLSPGSPQLPRNFAGKTYPKSILKQNSYVPTREPPIPIRHSRHTLTTASPPLPLAKSQLSPKYKSVILNSTEFLHSPTQSLTEACFYEEPAVQTEYAATPHVTAVEIGAVHSSSPSNQKQISTKPFSLVSGQEELETPLVQTMSQESSTISDDSSEYENEAIECLQALDNEAMLDFPTEFSPPEQRSPLNLSNNFVVHQDFMDEEAKALSARYTNFNREPSPSEEEANVKLLEAWEKSDDHGARLFCCKGPEHRGNTADPPLTQAKANRQSAIIGDDIISLRSTGAVPLKPPNFSRRQTATSVHAPLVSSNSAAAEVEHHKYATAITTPEVCKVLCAKPVENTPAVSCSLNQNKNACYVRQKFTTAKAKITGRSCVSAYYGNV